MRLLDTLRNAEKKGMSSVRKQVERAREEWNDMERRIRQRMRIYPQKQIEKKTTAGVPTSQQPQVPDDRGMAAKAPAGTPEPPEPSPTYRREPPDEDVDDSAA